MRLVDSSARLLPADQIRAAGYDGVVAYVSDSPPGADLGAQPITRAYAESLRAEGLHVVSNFQFAHSPMPSDFTRGFDGGVADARTALRLHEAAGGPPSAPIIFSIDEDIALSTWNRLAVRWFHGINSVLGIDRTGIYGHSRVCAWAIEDGVIGRSTTSGRRWAWQTKAWSNGGREPAAVLYQNVIDTASNPGPLIGGTRVNVSDVLADDYGQWDLDRSPGPVVAVPHFIESAEIRSPYHSNRQSTVKWFAIHTQERPTSAARNLARWLCDNDERVSYHYVVDNDGFLFNIVDTDQLANSLLEPGNSKTINLVFTGSFVAWTRQQWFDRMKHGMDVAAYIAVRDARRYGLQTKVISPDEAVHGKTGITDHNGVRIATRGDHTDVGPNFPWDYFHQKVDEFAAADVLRAPVAGVASFAGETLRQGDVGDDVALAQSQLNLDADAGLLVDGEFGLLTGRAVHRFQKARGLVSDATLNPETWAELFSEPTDDVDPDEYLGEYAADAASESDDNITVFRGVRLQPDLAEAASTRGLIDPGQPEHSARRITVATGPGHTDRFGMAATDLGVLARTPSGRILAVFGDTFRRPEVGGPHNDWRAPVALFSDTRNLDEGIVWSEAAGGDSDYARQLWPYPHANGSTALPSDVMTVGNTMYLHAHVNFPYPHVGFTEIWQSTDDGRTWQHTNAKFDGGLHHGLAQLWTWDVGDDGFVYVLSTGNQRNRPIILRRVSRDRIADPNAYEGWGFRDNGWAWGNEPTPVLEGRFGEMCLRRIQGKWVFVAFNAEPGAERIEVRVFPEITDNLYDVPMISSVRNGPWNQEGDDVVSQLYGPSIIPGSRLDGGFHILLSQWRNPGTWPYQVLHMKVPLPGLALRQSIVVDESSVVKQGASATPNGGKKPASRTSKARTTRSGSNRTPARQT